MCSPETSEESPADLAGFWRSCESIVDDALEASALLSPPSPVLEGEDMLQLFISAEGMGQGAWTWRGSFDSTVGVLLDSLSNHYGVSMGVFRVHAPRYSLLLSGAKRPFRLANWLTMGDVIVVSGRLLGGSKESGAALWYEKDRLYAIVAGELLLQEMEERSPWCFSTSEPVREEGVSKVQYQSSLLFPSESASRVATEEGDRLLAELDCSFAVKPVVPVSQVVGTEAQVAGRKRPSEFTREPKKVAPSISSVLQSSVSSSDFLKSGDLETVDR